MIIGLLIHGHRWPIPWQQQRRRPALGLNRCMIGPHSSNLTCLLGSDPMAKQTKWWHLALAWGFVGVPLIWGVIQTVLNAMKLFS